MKNAKYGLVLLLLGALGCGGQGPGSSGAAPTVSSTTPARAAVAVATNSKVSATFSAALDPSTVTAATFLVTKGTTAVPGAVSAQGKTASFVPAAPFEPQTKYTATLTVGLRDAAGTALGSAFTWDFTTGALPDTTAPFVVQVGGAGDVSATFSEPMAPATLTTNSFTVTAANGAQVTGVVSYADKIVTFQPATALPDGTLFAAKLVGGAAGVTDLAGNPLARDFTWRFTTGSHPGLAPVLLGGAGQYAILAESAISTVPTSAVTGDVAISPAAASYLTGFSLVAATGYATSTQVVGKVYAADYAAPTSNTLTTAVTDMGTAYTDAAGRPTPDFLELGTGAIGGLVLAPGLYKWSGTVTIASDLVLEGSASDVWIFQIAGDLTQSAGKRITLRGGASAAHVFWQVAGATRLGTTSHFEGILLCQTAIALQTGASFNGRALAQTAVTLDSNTLTQPAP